MGIVYRAIDERLNRAVALKFLPPEMHGNAIDRERFLREARVASSLDHPNIGVIHGVEDTGDGLTFIVMAFYEGTSLAERLRSGPLSIAESVDIASQMAKDSCRIGFFEAARNTGGQFPRKSYDAFSLLNGNLPFPCLFGDGSTFIPVRFLTPSMRVMLLIRDRKRKEVRLSIRRSS